MGWTGGGEILHDVWPTIHEALRNQRSARRLVYSKLVQALEDQDADTLGEVIDCYNKPVDPELVDVLIERLHWEPYDSA